MRCFSTSVARSEVTDKLFHVVDEDKNGALDISEFLEGIWTMIEAAR